MGKNRLRICIVNFPMSKTGSKASLIPILHLLKVLSTFSQDIHIITGNFSVNLISNEHIGAHILGISHKTRSNALTRVVNYVLTQLKISFKLMKVAKDVDFYIFFMMGQDLLFPMLTAKSLRKKVVLAFAVSSARSTEAKNDIFSKPLNLLSKINCTLANRIILYSPNLIKEWNLEKYRNKISIAHEHFLDFDKFNVKKKLSERNNLVGYIGRLSEEKGVLNFVKAIPEALKERDDLEFLIGGDGQLRDEIEEYISEKNLNDKVKLAGWIPHGNLPDYLNELKLVVLPSFTEGLPNIMLEAMACGTPVLATPVGAISDVIKDGETGFIMGNNSPECIAENAIRILEQPDLDKIVENARALVEQEFTYKAVVERYKKILLELRG